MGSDFIQKIAKASEKSWDKGRIDLCTADLFTQTPNGAACTVAAEILGNALLKPGEHVIVQKLGPGLIAMKGLRPVAQVINPSPDTLNAVEMSCNVANGTIEQVHELARVVEISLC